MVEPPDYVVVRPREQGGLVREVCPRCDAPYAIAPVETDGGVGHFFLCRCGVFYEDPYGRREVHAEG